MTAGIAADGEIVADATASTIAMIVVAVADAAVTVAVAGATAEMIAAGAVSSRIAGTVEAVASASANKNAPQGGVRFLFSRDSIRGR